MKRDAKQSYVPDFLEDSPFLPIGSPDDEFYPPLSYPPTAEFDWSQVAYAQYVTHSDYLCNAVMVFEALQRLGSQADRVLLYPSSFTVDGAGIESELLRKAKTMYNVNLVPIKVLRIETNYRNILCSLD
jgi:hypothetical protein